MPNSRYQRRPAAFLHRRLVAYELDDIRQMASLTTQLLQANLARREALDERAVTGLSESDREAYFESRADEYELVARHIPNQHQLSLVVMTYAMLESRLTSIAIGLRRFSEPAWTGTKLPGRSKLQAAKAVICEIASLPVPEQLWTNIDGYRLVRNVIVHDAGELEHLPTSFDPLREADPEVIELRSGQLVIQPGFVLAFTQACEALLTSVLHEWQVLEERSLADANRSNVQSS